MVREVDRKVDTHNAERKRVRKKKNTEIRKKNSRQPVRLTHRLVYRERF